MFNNKYSKFLTVILVIVIIAVIGLLCFLGYDFYKKYYITKEADNILEQFDGQVANTQEEENVVSNQVVTPIINEEVVTPSQGNNDNNGSSNNSGLTYNGFNVIGKIEIPKTNVKYPILETVTKKSIEKAVARLYGPDPNEVGNCVIVGHNYRNGLFFANNKKLNEGDKIYITDNSGRRVTYNIYKKYTTTPEDFDYATRDTNGKREISLSTCTDDIKHRLIIWAVEE